MTFYEVSPNVPADVLCEEEDLVVFHPEIINVPIATHSKYMFVLPMGESKIICCSASIGVTEDLADAIRNSGLTGVRVGPEAEVEMASGCDPERIGELPTLFSLIPDGVPMVDDFGVGGPIGGSIYVSQPAYDLLLAHEPTLAAWEVGPDGRPLPRDEAEFLRRVRARKKRDD
ncbi:MAG: hypothetical protein QM809_01470 [Gordonia sp. (in: high G+C Gram-positive bacteria)]|uniref:hypothetical protein n=1 Tax=Gordonia sp. (in: high G+C Gram-positive bacteria) TaxID=84139 RepID=UPI0039E56EBC